MRKCSEGAPAGVAYWGWKWSEAQQDCVCIPTKEKTSEVTGLDSGMLLGVIFREWGVGWVFAKSYDY